jgi:hypothetical protein
LAFWVTVAIMLLFLRVVGADPGRRGRRGMDPAEASLPDMDDRRPRAGGDRLV